MLNELFLAPFVLALVVSFAMAPLGIKIAKRLGAVDDPFQKKHVKKVHTYPVARSSLSLFLALLFASLFFLPLDKHLKGILAGALVLTVVGTLDDIYDLSPYLRLIAGFIAASLPIIAGIGIPFITNPFNGIIDLSQPQVSFFLLGEIRNIWILSDVFALLWIVFVMNMLNMGAKGVDGQLPGVVSIAALTIAALSLNFSADIAQWPVIILAAILSGSYLGFLPWNFYPQKVMPGYGGSTLAGYLLAVLSILSTTKVGTLMVVLGVPLIDTGYTIVRRILSGKSPVWGDTGHLHHRLLSLGWGKRRVAVFYWLITALLGILALNLNAPSKLYTMVGIAILLGGTLLWLTYRPKASK